MATDERLKPYRPILHRAGVDPSLALLKNFLPNHAPLFQRIPLPDCGEDVSRIAKPRRKAPQHETRRDIR